MELFIDPTAQEPLTWQLYEQIRAAIMEGRLQAGDRLTPSRTVAASLQVSRSTVTAVYNRLNAEGYIEGHSGGGSRVAPATLPSRPSRRVHPTLLPTASAAQATLFDDDPTETVPLDLRQGRVDPALFPSSAWRRSLVSAIDQTACNYGHPAGTVELRNALAHWIGRSRGVAATSDDVIVTSGAGQAIDLIARVQLQPGDVAAVEDPGYPPVVTLLRNLGVTVVGVPVDGQGIVVDAIPTAARLVYVTPSHQYPLGVVMARQRRLQLLDWACRNSAAVVEDDYDTEFRYTERPLEPLQRLDRDGRVIYVGTFSKSLAPSLRMGFLVAPPSLVPALWAIRQAVDWCPPIVMQDALAAFIVNGHLDRHLRKARGVYRHRHQLAWKALGDLLPASYDRLPSQAGLHVAVVGPDDPTDAHLRPALESRHVRVGSLRYNYQFSPPRSGCLVGFGALPAAHIGPAIEVLAQALAEAERSRSTLR